MNAQLDDDLERVQVQNGLSMHPASRVAAQEADDGDGDLPPYTTKRASSDGKYSSLWIRIHRKSPKVDKTHTASNGNYEEDVKQAWKFLCKHIDLVSEAARTTILNYVDQAPTTIENHFTNTNCNITHGTSNNRNRWGA